MRLKKPILLILLSFLLASSTSFALQSGDFTYEISGGNATITGYTGAGGVVLIPSILDTLTVIGIGPSAFQNKTNITDITIPGSILNVDYAAFYGCTGLTSLTISDGVMSIGNGAFNGCTGLISVTIPGSVLSIGNSAFYFCIGLTSLTIMDGVKIINDDAFNACIKLAAVSIPASVTSIGASPFAGCLLLTGISVDPSNPAYASQDGVLYNTTKTTLIQFPGNKSGGFTIPSSVTSIGKFAFYGCLGLTSVNLPNSISSIGESAFQESASLAAAYFYGNAPSMGTGVFDGCASGFTVYYLSGATGFANPWYGYPASVFTPTTTTTTSILPTTTTTSVEPTTSSTTTTIPASTTTTVMATTTTTTPGTPCPATKVLGADNPQLENLRNFRDSNLAQSAIGRRIIQIYYKNAESIDDALDRSPALKVFTRRMLEVIAPMVGREKNE